MDGAKNCIRVNQGGSWLSNTGVVRSAARIEGKPDSKRFDLEFRVVQDAE